MTATESVHDEPAVPSVVLIHGAWAGSWVWQPIVARLRAARGCDVIALDLPGSPGSSRPLDEVGLSGNLAEVGRQLERTRGRVVLVGHSGGGATVTAAAERYADRVAGVAFVAGMMLPSGVGFAQLCGEQPETPDGVVPHLRRTEDGRGTVVPPEVGAAVFFQRAGADAAIAASRQLSPQLDAGLALVPHWTPERFGSIPRLYVGARFDRAVPHTLQQHMQARTPGASVVTLDCDHCPQLSAPTELTAALLAFMDAL